ncbi:MAG: WD-repeat protein [Myxococcaceae bacterium]|nr:WD-repeat protein [Myxococcaceae bacterium]
MTLRAGAIAIVARADGAFAVEESGALGVYDADAKRTSELALPSGAVQAQPFADAWLCRVPGSTHLAPSNAKPVRGKPSVFADGGSDVTAFAVAVDGVAVARTDSLELWTHAGKQRWSVPGSWVAITIVTGHVIALADDGALVFTAMRDGSVVGTLRLASTEPASEWRLACIDAARVVLALGDWLVWIDVATKKTIRRVRARDKVTAFAADAQWVVAGTDTGWVQAFAADSGEPGAVFEAHDGGVVALALGKKTLFTGGAGGKKPGVRAWPRASLDVAKRAAAPVTALAARGDLVAVGDGSGNVRVLRGANEVWARSVGDVPTAVHLARGDVLIAATPKVILHASLAATGADAVPRPLAVRGQATAFAADDDYAFAGTDSGSVDVYDLAEATHVTSYALSDGDVTALARLPGKLLVVGTGALDGRVFIVDVTEAKVLHRMEPHDEAFGVTCLAYDPRGRIVASGADDGSIALIDPLKGKVLARLRVRETPTSLAFDKEGRRIACVFADGTAGLVKLGPRGATIEDIALTGVARVAWGDDAVFGFADGRIERLVASPQPAARSGRGAPIA